MYPLSEFSDLGLEGPILAALATAGYQQPTPIQTQAIPHVLRGRDLLGIAATGTGKTAAFALPILQRLTTTTDGKAIVPGRGTCRALVLVPTRELAAQVADSFRTYGRSLRLHVAVVVGGVAIGPQMTALAKGVDVLVATPGRLLDHVGRGTVRLDQASVLVLDEADHMLDLGFIPDVRKLVSRMPAKRQSLFFSATMPREIRSLADDFLTEPETVAVTPQATPAERIDQQLIHVDSGRKSDLLADILRDGDHGRVLVFTRTKRGADRVVRGLVAARIGAVAIHGNKTQSQRERALNGFRSGHAPVLVATDIAARGIDVDAIKLVVNFDLPHVAETYVHRIGRTARAGATGAAVSFCSPDEKPLLRAIEKLIRCVIPAQADPSAGKRPPRALPAVQDQRATTEAKPPRAAARPKTQKSPRPAAAAEGSARRGQDKRLEDLPFMRANEDRVRSAAARPGKRRPARKGGSRTAALAV